MNYSKSKHARQRLAASPKDKLTSWFFMLMCLFVAADVGHAQDQGWSITTTDFHSRPVVLTGFSETGIHVRAPGSNTDQTVALDDLLLLRRSMNVAVNRQSAAKGSYSLLLINGDHLIGEPVVLQDDKLTWSSSGFGEITFPISQLRCIARGSSATLPESPKQDTVLLLNKDVATGAISDLAKGVITVQTDAAAKSFPLAQVKSISFASTTDASESHGSPAYRISLYNRSIFTAKMIRLNDRQFEVTPTDTNGPALHVNVAEVASIERINGAVSWLSSQTPTENVQASFFGGSTRWPARFDLAVDGRPLVFEDHHYDYGIGVHAYSRLSFAIDPRWAGFRTQYAIHCPDQGRCPYADVTIRIKLDGKVVHEQTHLREGALSPVVSVDIRGGKLLTLECDYGENGDTQAAVNWLEPALLQTLPMERSNAK